MTTQHNQVTFDHSQQRDRMMRGMCTEWTGWRALYRLEPFREGLQAAWKTPLSIRGCHWCVLLLVIVTVIVVLVRIHSETS